MEQFYLSLLLLFVSFFFILWYRQRSPFIAPNLPPGNMGYPVIGESLAYLSTGWKGQPEKFIYERIIKYSSQIFKTSIFGEPTLMFCGPESNKFLFSNEDKLVRWWLPDHVSKIFPTALQSSSSNEEARRMRLMLPQFLNPKALQRYVGIMDSIARRHFASEWENKTEVTVFPLTKRYIFWLACHLFIGLEDPNHIAKFAEPFSVVSSGLIAMPIDFPGTSLNRAIKASKFIREELFKIIKQRKVDLADGKALPTQDILSHMLSISDENGQYVNEHFIADRILALLISGHDTVSATCTFIVKYLAELPQNIYQQVYEEQMEIVKSKSPGELLNWHDIEKMKYSWNVACEVMRIIPPVRGVFREAIDDFVFNGFSIPKGWKIYWSSNSTHQNPKYFPSPEKFDPSRFEGNGPAAYTYVPFGGGPRMCPGKEYARMEILIFMHNLVKGFKWKNVILHEKIVVDHFPVPLKGLPVRLYPQQIEKNYI